MTAISIRAGTGIGVCHVGLATRDYDLVRVLPDAFTMAFGTWVVAQGKGARTERLSTLSQRAPSGVVTPSQLLVLTGICPAEQQTARGISTRADLQDVGEILLDHHEVSVVARTKEH